MGLDSIAKLIGSIGAGIGSAIGRGISSFASGLEQPLGGDEEKCERQQDRCELSQEAMSCGCGGDQGAPLPLIAGLQMNFMS